MACGLWWVCGCRKGWGEGVFSDDDQRGNSADSLLGKQVSAGFGKLAEQVFAAKFLDIVSGATSVIGGICYARCGSNSVRQLPGSKSVRTTSQGEDGTEYGSGSGLIEVDATDSGFADLRGSRKLIEGVIADEGGIHVIQVAEELWRI